MLLSAAAAYSLPHPTRALFSLLAPRWVGPVTSRTVSEVTASRAKRSLIEVEINQIVRLLVGSLTATCHSTPC
jgi:hypothetical protein